MAPAAKKAKTDGEKEGEEAVQTGENAAEEEKPQGPPPELEQNAATAKGAKLKEPVTFHTQDTTLNCSPSAYGNILMPLTDGGLQFLLAGARASVGLKAGRYLFEVKVLQVMNFLEDQAVRNRVQLPRNVLRIGLSAPGSSLFLGDAEDSVCFDMDGVLLHNKKKEMCSQKFGQGDVLGVVVNLDPASPNANTVSLFKNGERACQPQALPEALRGKELFPTFTFKNVGFHYNFGPAPLAPLPFTCHMVGAALSKDAAVAAPPALKDGKHEVLFPVCLPDEGTFDWLDLHPPNRQYTELSDRAILAWAEKSGFPKPSKKRTSNDKPEMGFGVPAIDDGGVRRLLQTVAPMQPRNYIVMEVKSNLLPEERKALTEAWDPSTFKRTAAIMMGEPPAELRKQIQELTLKAKQEAADVEFRAKQIEAKRKRQLERRAKMLEREKKKAAKAAKKKQDALRKKLEAEKRKRERAARGEDPEEEEAEEAKAEEKDSDAEAPEDADMSGPEEEPPKVELTAEERKQCYRKTGVPDMAAYALSTSFMKFSLPEKDEGFEEVRHAWGKAAQCEEYLRQWVRDRKLTTRIEDLQPSEWFQGKLRDWQKTLQSWHAKANQHKAAVAKKKMDAEKAAALAKAKAAAKEKAAEGKTEEGEEAAAEAEAKEGTTAEEKEEPAVDFDRLDVFGVEDILNIGGGQPLFSAFAYEDWAMLCLRFEIYLLTHAFRRDVNDPDRVGINLEHLQFYYQKYFKKALTPKLYGVDSVKELLDFVKDTIAVCGKNQVVQAMLPDDMESMGVFAMIAEESRRDRMRRVVLGEEGAAFKMSPQPATFRRMAASSSGDGAPLAERGQHAYAGTGSHHKLVRKRPFRGIISPEDPDRRPAAPAPAPAAAAADPLPHEGAWGCPSRLPPGGRGWGEASWRRGLAAPGRAGVGGAVKD